MKNRSSHKSPPGQRQLRVAERIRHILADIMREDKMHDPALANSNMISITAVEIGPDLKHATAYVMPLGGKNAAAIVEALNRAAGFLRSEVGPQLDLRYTPKISFRIDNSFDEAEHINNILNQDRVRRDLEKHQDDADADSNEK